MEASRRPMLLTLSPPSAMLVMCRITVSVVAGMEARPRAVHQRAKAAKSRR
jgi:hypothetical protein